MSERFFCACLYLVFEFRNTALLTSSLFLQYLFNNTIPDEKVFSGFVNSILLPSHICTLLRRLLSKLGLHIKYNVHYTCYREQSVYWLYKDIDLS